MPAIAPMGRSYKVPESYRNANVTHIRRRTCVIHRSSTDKPRLAP